MAVTARDWLRSTVGILTVAVVSMVAFTMFAVNLITRSHLDDGRDEVAVVRDTVRIYRNSFGLPHIIGSSDADVISGQGYVHAQDRLWQMDMWRRFGQGRLAEVLGSKAVSTDVFARSLDIPGIAARQYEALDQSTRDILIAYANGVNAFIDTHRELLPLEFDALGYQPERWKPTDCLIVGRVVAFELSTAFWNDIAYAQIAQQRGLRAVVDYIPSSPGAPYVMDSSRTAPAEAPAAPSLAEDASGGRPLHYLSDLHSTITEARRTLGASGSAIGSNCWAVGRSNRSAILANDPHLSVSLPPKWHYVHLTGRTLNVSGLSLPGVPCVLSGRNDDIAWGITNIMVDDVDYFVEQVAASDPENYYYDPSGQRKKFRFRTDTVRINGEAPLAIERRYTDRGCVISDAHLLKDPTTVFGIDRKKTGRYLDTTCLTFRWTAQEVSNEIGALFRINRARTINEVYAATASWKSPAFNLHVAERRGRVATMLTGIVPNRINMSALLPTPVSRTGSGWNGFTHLRTFGLRTTNPPGYLASANNRTIRDQRPFLSTLFHPAARAQRIDSLARVYANMSVRDAQVMQMDQVSPYAQDVLRAVLPILESGKDKYSLNGKAALKALREWDGAMTTVSMAATVYTVFLRQMIKHTFEDELGTRLFQDWSLITTNPLNRLTDLLRQPSHPLFDDSRTKGRENLTWITLTSFLASLDELQTLFPDQPVSEWQYGRLHQLVLPHILGTHPLMRPVMSLGPFEIGGSETTLFNTEWALHKPYQTSVYPSARIISDLADTIQYVVLPGGTSGEPLSKHYSDQVQLWLRGGYLRVSTTRRVDPTAALHTRLLPR